MRSILLILFVAGVGLYGAPLLQAQPQVTITGRVTDKADGQPLANVGVYIANSTLGAATDVDGSFRITHVPLGRHELIASRVGYQRQTQNLLIEDPKDREVNFRLELQVVEVGAIEVVAEQSKKWDRDLKKFKEGFLGASSNAEDCRILNLEVLDFDTDSEGAFVAVAAQPLVIDNQALGYHIEYDLEDFRALAGEVEFKGKARFEAMTSVKQKDLARWATARERAYRGSLRHFLAALTADATRSEGFLFYSAFDLGEQDTRVINREDILLNTASPFEKDLRVRRYLKVVYTGEEEEMAYVALRTRHGQLEPGDQVSWIELLLPSARFYARGHLRDPYAVKVHGYWAWERLADMLPLDYQPR